MSDARDADRLAAIRRFYAHVSGTSDSDYAVLLRCLDAAEAAILTHRDRATALTQELAVAKAEAEEMRRDRDAALAVALRVGTSIFDITEAAAGRRLARSFSAWSIPLMQEEAARLAQLILAPASPAAEVATDA